MTCSERHRPRPAGTAITLHRVSVANSLCYASFGDALADIVVIELSRGRSVDVVCASGVVVDTLVQSITKFLGGRVDVYRPQEHTICLLWFEHDKAGGALRVFVHRRVPSITGVGRTLVFDYVRANSIDVVHRLIQPLLFGDATHIHIVLNQCDSIKVPFWVHAIQ